MVDRHLQRRRHTHTEIYIDSSLLYKQTPNIPSNYELRHIDSRSILCDVYCALYILVEVVHISTK